MHNKQIEETMSNPTTEPDTEHTLYFSKEVNESKNLYRCTRCDSEVVASTPLEAVKIHEAEQAETPPTSTEMSY